MATVIAFQASGYVQPAISVGAGEVSWALNHPLSVGVGVILAVNVGGGNVATVPVGVYDGKDAGAPAFAIDTGGQGNAALSEAEMLPAPAPPVCHGWYAPSKMGPETPSEAHLPTVSLGSVGIHPFWRPS